MLVGSNREESRLFLVAPAPSTWSTSRRSPVARRRTASRRTSLELYRENRPEASPGDVMAAVVTDWFFAVPAIRHAEAREAGGGTTWAYRFDRPSPADNHNFGACHAVEIPFVFDNIGLDQSKPLIGDTPSQEVADTAHAAWVSFVTTGDPGWAAYTTQTRTTGCSPRS